MANRTRDVTKIERIRDQVEEQIRRDEASGFGFHPMPYGLDELQEPPKQASNSRQTR